jgi:hypothetical protein
VQQISTYIKIEFVVVTHESMDSCLKCRKDMAILSIPEAFLVYTGCKDSAEFANAIVHISCAFDYLQVLAKHKYCSVNGSIVFRHPTSLRTAVMNMVSEKILLDPGQITRSTTSRGKTTTGSVSFLEYYM